MSVKLLTTEHHLAFLSIKVACTGSSESTLVKMPHCWKSHVAAHMTFSILFLFLAVSWVGLQCVTVAFPGHSHFFPSAYMPNVYDDCHNYCLIQKYIGYNSCMLQLQLLLNSGTTVSGSHVRYMALL